MSYLHDNSLNILTSQTSFQVQFLRHIKAPNVSVFHTQSDSGLELVREALAISIRGQPKHVGCENSN